MGKPGQLLTAIGKVEELRRDEPFSLFVPLHMRISVFRYLHKMSIRDVLSYKRGKQKLKTKAEQIIQ